MDSRRTLANLAICSLIGLLPACRASPPPRPRAAPPDPRAAEGPLAGAGPILPGTTTDLDLDAGAVFETPVAPTTPSYFELVVEQRSLDVVVSLEDAAGRVVARADGPGGIGIDERLAHRLRPERYTVRLRGHSDGPKSGRVRMRIEALRPWTAEDARRLDLVRLGQQATHLDGSNSQADWQRSLELSRRELAGWRALGDERAIVRTLDRLGSLERELGEVESSIAHGREAVAISLAIGDRQAEAAARYWLAQSLNRDGRVAEAQDELARGLEAATEVGDLRLEGRILNWQGRLALRGGDLEAASSLFVRALELRTEARDVRGITAMLNNLAVIAQRRGQPLQAIDYLRQVVAVARTLDAPGTELLALSNMAGAFEDRGQWQETLDTLSVALERATALGDHRNEAEISRALARLLIKLGETGPARSLLERALGIERSRRDPYAQTSTLLAIGWLEIDRGNLESAERALGEALDLCSRQATTELEAAALRALARVRTLQDRPLDALSLLRRAEAGTSVERPPERANVLADIAEVELSLARPREAEATLATAITVLADLEAPEVRFSIAYQQARLAHAVGELERARELADLALGIAESLRSSVDDPDLRATYVSRVHEAYGFSVDLLLELHELHPDRGFDSDAFSTHERARARSLVELLSSASEGAEPTIDPALLEAERAARAGVAEARQRLDEPARDRSTTDRTSTVEELAAARRRLREAEEAIRRVSPKYAALRYGSRTSVGEVQESLPADTALVEYSLRPERSVAFVVTRDSFDTVRLEGEEVIATWSSLLRETLTSPRRRSFGQLRQRAGVLGKLLVEPVLAALTPFPHLIVVPDGILGYIPFEALRVPAAERPRDEEYLIEQKSVRYAPSSGVLLSLARQARGGPPGDGLVALADPEPPRTAPRRGPAEPAPAELSWPRLPGARREIAMVAATLSDTATRTWMDRAASEWRVKSEPGVAGARWIHLAAHALVDEETPANSAVVLAPDPARGEDGYLTVREVFGLDLAAELVVLSGCETALGRQIRGEGLIGLTRAFLYAGAGGVEVSLWKVADDTTPALMSSFYDALRGGHSSAAALRQAKLESLEDPRRAHPFHWAPFVLIGGAS